jgi:predicted nucleic acid-binding protein
MEGNIKLVIDTSVFIRLLKPESYTRGLFYRITAVITPYLIYEIYKHKRRISKFTEIPEEDILKVVGYLLEFCEICSEVEYFDKWDEAYEIAKNFDLKDTPFIALSLKLGIPIWTNDKKMIVHGLKSGKYLALDTQAVEDFINGKSLDEVKESLMVRFLNI